jgi:hypothetical protein
MRKILYLVLITALILGFTPCVEAVSSGSVLSRNNPEKEYILIINRSGGSLANGDVVIFDVSEESATTAIPVTTSTTVDDNLVIGVMTETVADDGYGVCQVYGYHPAAKVDGSSENLAAGDFLGQSGTAKKSAKGAGLGIVLDAITTDTTAEVFIMCRGSRGKDRETVVISLADGFAGTEYETPCLYASTALEILSIGLVPNTAVTAAAANCYVFTVYNRGTDGSGTTQIVTKNTSASAFVADDYWTLGTLSNASVSAGAVFYFDYDESGNPADVSECLLIIGFRKE